MNKTKRIEWVKIRDGSYENALVKPLRFDFKVKPHGPGYVVIVDDIFSGTTIETVPVGTVDAGKDWCEDYLDKYGEANVFGS